MGALPPTNRLDAVNQLNQDLGEMNKILDKQPSTPKEALQQIESIKSIFNNAIEKFNNAVEDLGPGASDANLITDKKIKKIIILASAHENLLINVKNDILRSTQAP
jgi:hypothetical protein